MNARVAVLTIAEGKQRLDPRRFEVEPGADIDHARDVILAATDRPLSGRQAAQVRDFVRRGGGLVLVGGTLAAWSESEAIRQVAGWVPGGQGPRTELIVRPDPGHPITQRLDPEWKVRDVLQLAEGPPVEASILLRTSWRYTEQVVAYERKFGDGRFVFIGVADDGSSNFEKLLGRSVLFAAGRSAAPPVGVGLLGYGAIGRDHAASIAATSGLRLAGVCDISAERRDQAAREWSVRTHADASAMLEDPDVGLVVIGTPPSAHTDPALRALAAGKHVVCEKPFALRAADGDRMIDAAASRGLVLTVFQSRRWDPDFIALRDTARSGRIGEPFYLESFIGGYDHPCDLWHSHEPISGGMIYDWGSHYFDWILQLFPDTVRIVEAQAHKRVWHDVTNSDQVRVDVTYASGAQAMFFQSDIAAARKPKWYMLGTQGAVVGDWVEADVPSDFPARVRVVRRSGEESLVLPPREEHGFYRNLADHLAWSEALAVTAEEARRTVAVMEAATESIARGGAQVKVEI
ncbi:MAG TPA: Gfo/Idh/MocA family oxidoreductase [Candidatus Limnocylindrales bacterium]|nr:Gfo/Idh/MocA family oxidoreductase [Candidatus Limnocylindrales bacterium]